MDQKLIWFDRKWTFWSFWNDWQMIWTLTQTTEFERFRLGKSRIDNRMVSRSRSWTSNSTSNWRQIGLWPSLKHHLSLKKEWQSFPQLFDSQPIIAVAFLNWIGDLFLKHFYDEPSIRQQIGSRNAHYAKVQTLKLPKRQKLWIFLHFITFRRENLT